MDLSLIIITILCVSYLILFIKNENRKIKIFKLEIYLNSSRYSHSATYILMLMHKYGVSKCDDFPTIDDIMANDLRIDEGNFPHTFNKKEEHYEQMDRTNS